MAPRVFPWWVSREKGGRELSPLSFLSHPSSLQRRRAQSRVGVSWGCSQAALLVPAGMACPVSLLPGGRKASGQEQGAVPDRAGSRFSDKRFILEGGNERTPDLLFQSPGLQRDRLS